MYVSLQPFVLWFTFVFISLPELTLGVELKVCLSFYYNLWDSDLGSQSLRA